MNRIGKPAAALAGVLGLLAGTSHATAGAGQATASGEKAAVVVKVRGTQVPINLGQGTYESRGDLVGKWWVLTTEVQHSSPTLFVATGRERFRGCLDTDRDRECTGADPAGVMRFAYVYWATLDSEGNLVRGECTHPVTGGNGSFAGARGVLRMVDRPVAGGGVRTKYHGRLVLDGGAMKASPAPPSRLGSTATLARPTPMAC